eukprot:651626-Pyramimonas_sp.AAC.1
MSRRRGAERGAGQNWSVKVIQKVVDPMPIPMGLLDRDNGVGVHKLGEVAQLAVSEPGVVVEERPGVPR